MNRLRPRTAAAITVAVLSLSITPMAVQGSAWASSGGGSSKASSSKRPTSQIAHFGAEGNASGASSGEDSDSTGGQPSNSKRVKKNSSSQKVHTKNNQAFQKVVLEELKKSSEGLSTKELTNKLISSNLLVKHGGQMITQGALSTLERKGTAEKVADSSPIKYRITEKGRGRTSLMRERLTTEELKDEIIEMFGGYPVSTGMSKHEIFRKLDYVRRNPSLSHGDLLGQMVAAGELVLTPEGRYSLPQR